MSKIPGEDTNMRSRNICSSSYVDGGVGGKRQ